MIPTMPRHVSDAIFFPLLAQVLEFHFNHWNGLNSFKSSQQGAHGLNVLTDLSATPGDPPSSF